jgi:hypothetical protein
MTDATPRLAYTKGHERPTHALTWLDAADDVVDLSTAVLTLAIGTPGREAEYVKTTGIDGAAVAPNVVIEWSDNELDHLDPGMHRGQLSAIDSDANYRGPFPLTIEIYDAITVPAS